MVSSACVCLNPPLLRKNTRERGKQVFDEVEQKVQTTRTFSMRLTTGSDSQFTGNTRHGEIC
jgi:hypothetical protein